jgi:hypothetical protein
MNTIKLFESKNIRSVWNEADEKWYFSVQDVVSILTETVDAKDYIKKIKKRDLQLNNNWGTICPLVEMVAGDVAGNARKELEIKTGEKVVSPTNYKVLEEKKQKRIK